MTTARRPRTRSGFTLLELLIVIAIIVILISILLPVASTVRLRAQVTQTRAQMARLQQAIMMYYHDWNAYPGPIPNSQLANNSGQIRTTGLTGIPVTSSENLALGLLGYIDPNYGSNQVPPPTNFPIDPNLMPPGPPRPPKHDVLNLTTPKTYHYIDFIASEVSNGYWLGGINQRVNTDSSGSPQAISDTIVPEFVDSINAGLGPMPILYIRANAGAAGIVYSSSGNVQGLSTNPIQQYDASQFIPYGFTTVSATDFPVVQGMNPPSSWTAYLTNPNIANTPRGKDGFLLISAGADRQYGTADDIFVTP